MRRLYKATFFPSDEDDERRDEAIAAKDIRSALKVAIALYGVGEVCSVGLHYESGEADEILVGD